MNFIPDNLFIHIGILAVSFLILAKSADFLVDGAVGLAHRFQIPKLVIGIVLVGFATTAPEFTVSLLSAIRGFPEIALGNAVGSVIVDDALALGLGIIVAPTVIKVEKRSLRWFGLFLIGIDIFAFILSLNGVFERWEGLVLLALLVAYLTVLLVSEKRKKTVDREAVDEWDLVAHIKPGSTGLQILRFGLGLAGIILASEFLIDSSVFVADFFGASKAVIGLTVVAIGTSLPEIATCIIAARKGHGDLAFGNIIGADILNVLWIIGAAAVANPIRVERRVMLFAFPWMIGVVALMLLFARMGYKLQRWKGVVLVVVYLVYLSVSIWLFYTP